MSAGKVVRIAGGQGFWGDWLEAPVRAAVARFRMRLTHR